MLLADQGAKHSQISRGGNHNMSQPARSHQDWEYTPKVGTTLNVGGGSGVTRTVEYTPKVATTLNVGGGSGVTRTVEYTPKVGTTLNVGGGSGVTRTVEYTPKVGTTLNVGGGSGVTRTVEYTAKVGTTLNVGGGSGVTRTVEYTPKVGTTLNVGGGSGVTRTVEYTPKVGTTLNVGGGSGVTRTVEYTPKVGTTLNVGGGSGVTRTVEYTPKVATTLNVGGGSGVTRTRSHQDCGVHSQGGHYINWVAAESPGLWSTLPRWALHLMWVVAAESPGLWSTLPRWALHNGGSGVTRTVEYTPKTVEVDEPNVTVEVYRAPGGKARTFLVDDRLNGVLQKEFELVILWLGSNAIKGNSKVEAIVEDIRKVVETWQATCQCDELTDNNVDRILNSISEVQYDWMEDPQDFANKLKCKYAILEAKSKYPGEIPRRDKIIKKKLLRGLPSHSKEKLELFMDEQIPLKKFIERVETERAIAIGRDADKMFTVNQPRQPSEITPASPSSPPNTQEQSQELSASQSE
ncbi:hypothetical protein GWK47_045639 [Chionoecetes opilio]|uniref:Uncharacterized protein n=1 Tax=Chionoecetes opilio TaxID=41210 RepID=A0A8J4YEL6_CHIOP|nr:hypothetical protein GWK47_045639 [Chionoecetes opilio]